MSDARPKPLSPEEFAEAERVSRETLNRLSGYIALLERWQSRINLVGQSTLRDPWRSHILDCAQLAPIVVGRTVVDIGSGAGLPGLILAILLPNLEIHLIESDARKCAFLREAAREALVTVHIHLARAEEMAPFPCDTVVARAVAPLHELLGLARPFTPKVCVFPKGENVERELTESKKNWKFQEERFPSRSDPRGVILRLREIEHVQPDLRRRQPEGGRR